MTLRPPIPTTLIILLLLALCTSCKKTPEPVTPEEIEEIEDPEPPTDLGERLAFPGAEGFGAYTWGGRGGKVLHVTTLEDNGNNNSPIEGSLRWAVVQSGARTVVFDVSGTIQLKSTLNINRDSISIAGQTAPGDGICIRDYTVNVNASQVIVRYVRFRLGDEAEREDDSFWGRRQGNIILDHCSMSWATDELSSWYDNDNFTMQWCLLSESLRVSVHNKGAHGYTGIWGGRGASFHHNLIAHSDSRNPRFCGSRYSNRESEELVDFRNNVIYNWGANSGYAGEGGRYNMVNNYYQPGAQSSNNARIFQPYPDDGSNSQRAGVWGMFYVSGNVMKNVDGSTNQSVTYDNWNGIHPSQNSKPKSELRSDVEYDKGYITTHTAEEAYELVLTHSGASLVRDAVDARVVDEVRNRLAPKRAASALNREEYAIVTATRDGLIDSQNDVGGWPTLNSLPAPTCTMRDGIPDAWKTANGLDVNRHVANEYTLSNVYTNLEMYTNSLIGE